MKYLLLKQLRDFKSNVFLNISVFLIAFFGVFFFSGLNAVGSSLDSGIERFYGEQKLASYTVVSKLNAEQLANVRESVCADGAAELNAVTIKIGDINRNAEISLFPNKDFKVNIPEIVEGEAPMDSFDALMDVGFAHANGVDVGDVFEIKLEGSPYDVTVCGFARFPDHLYKGEAIPELEETGILKVFVDLDIQIDTLYIRSELDESELRNKLTELTGTNFDKALFFGREDNVSVARIKTDLQLIDSLISILPIVCLVALCLILYINMSKRIEDESYTIGVMSANGMKKSLIATAYCLPYLVWILIGGIIGAGFGVAFLPSVYIDVLKGFYTLPELPATGVVGAVALPVAVLAAVTVVALVIAIIGIMTRTPSQLMRGRTKKSVKVFKRIGLPLTLKLSVRNFLSYKKKSLFTVISATLCLALLLTSFLLDNSVDNLQETVYGKYYNYDTTISWNAGDRLNYDEIVDSVRDSQLFDKTMYCVEFPATVLIGDEQKNIMVSIIDDEDPCYDLFDDNEKIDFSDSGVYIPKSYGLKDSIELKIYGMSDDSLTLPIGGTFTDIGMFGVVFTRAFTQKNEDFVKFVMMHSSDFAELNTAVYMTKKETVSEENIKDFVVELEEKFSAAFMYERHDVHSERFKQLFKVLDITELVLFVICGIMMILLILNISCLSISDRIKDYTIFKALGVGTKRINFLNSLENYCSVIIAFALSLPVGMFITEHIIKGVTLITGVAVYLHVYVASVLILLGGAAMFAAISNILINRNIKKVNIVDSLKIKE